MTQNFQKLHNQTKSSLFYDSEHHLKRFKEDIIAQYVGLSLCLHIKNELGLEAMIEYMQKVHLLMGERCPAMQQAMHQILDKIDIKQHFEVMRSNHSLD